MNDELEKQTDEVKSELTEDEKRELKRKERNQFSFKQLFEQRGQVFLNNLGTSSVAETSRGRYTIDSKGTWKKN